jgi:hypothetical protein
MCNQNKIVNNDISDKHVLSVFGAVVDFLDLGWVKGVKFDFG